MSQKVSTFLYYICQFNKGLDSMVLQAHEVASLVYVKSGGMELGDTAAFPNGANGRAGCNMWSLYNFPFHFKQVKLFQIHSTLSNFIVLKINYAIDQNAKRI